MADLQVIIQKHPEGVVTILLNGNIDAYSYAQLEQTLNRLVDQRNYKFIIDLSRVDYLGSAGAGIFIGLFGVTQENKGDIVLVNPKSNVREVFELLGLTQLFTIVKDRKSALDILVNKKTS